MVRQASVEAGAPTTAHFDLRVGEVSESVTVDAASPQLHYDSHGVGGLITHSQIQNLPLNGRSFLERAKLQPAAQPPARGADKHTFVPSRSARPGGNTRWGAPLQRQRGRSTTIRERMPAQAVRR